MLYDEQGLGDTIQFIRYADLVKRQGAGVVVECHGCLVPLLARSAGIDEVVPRGGVLPSFDVQCPLLSLARVFKTTLETIPRNVPYLFADPALVERWQGRLSRQPGFRVGIVWQGRPTFPGDRYRSIPLVQFAHQLFIRGRFLKGIVAQDLKQSLHISHADSRPPACARLPMPILHHVSSRATSTRSRQG